MEGARPNVLATIAALRRRAERLNRLADDLHEELSRSSSTHGPKPATKFSELREYIRVHGPISRRVITKESGLPYSTVCGYLTAKFFRRNENGLWMIKGEVPLDNG